MVQNQLEQALRNFKQIATLLHQNKNRQEWSFDFAGKAYLLHFYPRGKALVRWWRVGSALVEFLNLQAMQRASIPAPRAVAHLSGFRIGSILGDAVIIEAIDNALPLDEYLRRLHLNGQSPPDRRGLARQVVDIIFRIGKLKLGHRDLRLSSFLISGGKVYLQDVGGLCQGGFKMRDLYTFAHDVSCFATRSELLRGWRTLVGQLPMPRDNPRSSVLWRRFIRQTRCENADFGRLRIGSWSGCFVKTARLARPWSVASSLQINADHWRSLWPILLAKIESGQLTPLKSDASGQVLSDRIRLAERDIEIVIKRPRRRGWHRYVMDLFRPSRAMRMWQKAWMLIARDLPCEWPLLVMEKSLLGYVTDAVVVFERVPGQPLDRVNLDVMPPDDRQTLFRRAGRILRLIERSGLAHYDAKSSNWIVYHDPGRGPTPIMIDTDGIRPLNFWLSAWGIRRLLRAMRQHPQYTPADSLALCQGYAPLARCFVEEQRNTQVS